jgi:hypothetical protein
MAPEMKPRMNADERGSNKIGLDLDIWGGEVTTPVLIPQSPEHCVAAEGGRCPPGCRECADFADQMGITYDQFSI